MSAKTRKCPICGKPADPAAPWFPFCSKRCRTQDLGNWAAGAYSVPSPASEADEHFESQDDPEEQQWNA